MFHSNSVGQCTDWVGTNTSKRGTHSYNVSFYVCPHFSSLSWRSPNSTSISHALSTHRSVSWTLRQYLHKHQEAGWHPHSCSQVPTLRKCTVTWKLLHTCGRRDEPVLNQEALYYIWAARGVQNKPKIRSYIGTDSQGYLYEKSTQPCYLHATTKGKWGKIIAQMK